MDAEKFLSSLKGTATYYRCVIVVARRRLSFPDSTKPTFRFDNQERTTPGYLLRPFEPPLIPIRATYEILYFDRTGRPLHSPPNRALLELEPFAPDVAYEDGECLDKVPIPFS